MRKMVMTKNNVVLLIEKVFYRPKNCFLQNCKKITVKNSKYGYFSCYLRLILTELVKRPKRV